jgi:arylsulfatase A-like enzyme
MRNVDEGGIPEPAGIEWVRDPLHPKCFAQTEGAHQAMPQDWRTTRHYYLADLTHLDEQLGRVTKALEESGRAENTYLVMLSDHGELFLDHGFTGKGERHYDACVRVPLMISGPGLQAGLAREEAVQLEDIFPTVMDMAGLTVPAPRAIGPYLKMSEGAEEYPGKSLLPLGRGEHPARWRDELWIESYNNIGSTTPAFWARTVRTRDWRYTLYPGGQGEQLFSLGNDPDEQRNLAGDAGSVAARREMRDRLLEKVILQDYPHTRHGLFSLGVF